MCGLGAVRAYEEGATGHKSWRGAAANGGGVGVWWDRPGRQGWEKEQPGDGPRADLSFAVFD